MRKSGDETPATVRLRWQDALLTAVLLLGTILVYLPAMRGGFIWDDDIHFTANSAVMRWRGLFDIWTSRTAVYYPLVLITGWVLHKVAGFNPLVFHAVTLALHFAAAVLLVAVMRRFRIPWAWLAGFLFAWHPVQVESAAWITELKNTQSAFFMLLSVLFLQVSGFFEHPFPRDRRERWSRYASVFLFILAVLSKTSVVMLPAVLAALVWWKRGIRRWADVDGLFPFLIVALLGAGWTIWEQRYSSGAHGFEWDQSLPERIVLAGQVMGFYLAKLTWPANLMFLYPRWEVFTGPMSLLPLAGLLAAGGILWTRRAAWGRGPGLVLLVYALFIFPVTGLFNVYFMRYAWVADHFAYLAVIPLFAGASVLAARLAVRRRAVAFALAVLVIGSCAVLSHRHAHAFRDPETLWRSALEKNPAAWMAHNNLGLLLKERGDDEGAVHHFESALKYNPGHYEALNNLGTVYRDRGEPEKALAYFDQALALRPELYHAWINRGGVLEGLGDIEGAYAAYEEAASLKPDLEAAYVHAALLAERRGDADRVYRSYRRLLEVKKLPPDQIGGFLYERAYTISRWGQPDLAIALLDRAAALAPGLADLHLLRGMLYEEQRDYDRAEKSYRMALSLRGDWGAVLLRLSRLLCAQPETAARNPREGLAMAEAMMKAGGNGVAEIIDAYAIALAANGRYGEAMQAQGRAMELAADDAARAAMAERFALYRRGESFTLPPPEAGKP